ncbi:MAG: redoxin domain-containing protein [Acidobacteria bacterium]|nr:redoxin domain-containing protein [Acidobacteriota bacterium]
MKKLLLILGISVMMILALTSIFFAEDVKFEPAQIEQEMATFKLPTVVGGEFDLASFKGKKNVMLIFPRGYAGKDYWCSLCGYQWAEWVEFEKANKIQEKFDLEIAVILPYNLETVKKWVESLPTQLETVEKWRHPAEDAQQGMKDWADYLNKNLPQKILYTKENLPMPFPVLVDGERTLSNKLGLFQTKWTGREAEQNIPTTIILNKDGKVVFKFMAQTTLDRPSPEYVLKIMKTFL